MTSKVILHDQYRVGARFNNDIAILKLQSPFYDTDFVKPACLPNPSYKVQTGTAVVVSGWGATQTSKHFDKPLFFKNIF